RPIGFDVIRIEVLPGDKVKSEVLVGYVDVKDNKISETKQFHINKKLEKLLRQSIYDERSAEMMKDHIWAGLTMPMPRLANSQYPKFEFKGFEFDWTMMEDEENRPNMLAGGVPGQKEMPPPRGKGIEMPGFPKGFERPKPGDKKFGQPGEGDAKEPSTEYLLKDTTEKELKESNPGLITRVFGGKEKRVEQDFNVYHVLGRY